MAESAEHAVSDANRRFYGAFESLDLERMESVWWRDNSITCTHPGWARLSGWGPVMKSWEDIFASTFGMRFAIDDEVVHVAVDVAWVTCTERLESRGYDGVLKSAVEATNVFVRRDGEWRLAHHHGSPIVRRADPGETLLQ